MGAFPEKPPPRSKPPPTRTQNCRLPALLPQSPGSTPPHLHAVGVVFPADLLHRHLVLCLEKDLGEIVIISHSFSGQAGPWWGDAYHSHLLLEVIQIPALFGLALLGRALVIFLVLRGGDTVAVRATRLRARRGSRATPAPSAQLSFWPGLSVPHCLSGVFGHLPEFPAPPPPPQTCLI